MGVLKDREQPERPGRVETPDEIRKHIGEGVYTKSVFLTRVKMLLGETTTPNGKKLYPQLLEDAAAYFTAPADGRERVWRYGEDFVDREKLVTGLEKIFNDVLPPERKDAGPHLLLDIAQSLKRGKRRRSRGDEPDPLEQTSRALKEMRDARGKKD